MKPAFTLQGIAQVLRAADLSVEVRGSEDAAVLGAAQDSRAVKAGDLFLAWAGTAFDAHDFVADAVRAGAVGAVVERALDLPVTQLIVDDGRRAAALIADCLAGSPWKRASLVGITGTNGKTTTTALLRHILSHDRPTASIGTLGVLQADGSLMPGTEGLTTPGPVQLSDWMAALVENGTEAIVLEASSHALDQGRLAGVRFDVGVFTNLSQDHLDYHGDLASYANAKRGLAELVGPDGTLVVNADEPAWEGLPYFRRLSWSATGNEQADLIAEGIVSGGSGTRFLIRQGDERSAVRLPLVGAYNVENALAAAAAALSLGVSLATVVERLETAPQIAGRLEVVADAPITVIIDFAHTPDALRNALGTLREIARKRLIVLFGAGGDRDAAKRAPMGEAVAEFADLAVLTSDNPRTEDPDSILDQIQPGLGSTAFIREVDRTAAIGRAIAEAEAGDVVVLAGKGHEAYQVIGTEKRAFDEKAIALAALQRRGIA